MVQALVLDRRDNVATAVAALDLGEPVALHVPDVGGRTVTALEPIAYGHKLALVDIPAGGEVVKYGEVIGLARQAIPAGAHVHVHNVASRRAQALARAPTVDAP